MKSWFKRHWKSDLVRPVIYKTFTRFLLALTVALLWGNYAPHDAFLSSRMYAFFFLGFYFALCAWLVHMRMDGLHIPRVRLRVRRKHDPVRTYGDMSDYTDEPIRSFDDLEDDEKDFCSLLANLLCCMLYLLLSFLV